MAHNLCLIVHYVPPVNENTALGRVTLRAEERWSEIRDRGPPRFSYARPEPRSSPVFEAGKNDISRNRYPKRVIADEGDLDEHPDDCKPRENKR